MVCMMPFDDLKKFFMRFQSCGWFVVQVLGCDGAVLTPKFSRYSAAYAFVSDSKLATAQYWHSFSVSEKATLARLARLSEIEGHYLDDNFFEQSVYVQERLAGVCEQLARGYFDYLQRYQHMVSAGLIDWPVLVRGHFKALWLRASMRYLMVSGNLSFDDFAEGADA